MSLPSDERQLLALVVQTDGTADLRRLPAGDVAATAAVHEAVGGNIEPIGGRDWIAYVAEDARQFPDGLYPNLQADALARTLGWESAGDFVKGTAVFLGRAGVHERDVPERVLDLARAAGLVGATA